MANYGVTMKKKLKLSKRLITIGLHKAICITCYKNI